MDKKLKEVFGDNCDNCVDIIKQSLQVALFTLVISSFINGDKETLDKIGKWLEVDSNEL